MRARALLPLVVAMFVAGCASRNCRCPCPSQSPSAVALAFADINGEGGNLWTTDGHFESADGGESWTRVKRTRFSPFRGHPWSGDHCSTEQSVIPATPNR